MKNSKYYTADVNVIGELVECSCYTTVNSRYYMVDNGQSKKEENVLKEHHFNIILDGKLFVRLVCTPVQLTALVVGYLITSGTISLVEDIDMIKYNKDNTICEVWLKKKMVVDGIKENRITLNKSKQKSYDCVGAKVIRKAPFFWEPKWITNLATFFKKDTELHAMTHGTHSCFLAQEGKVLYVCEDIGRHNALDKVVGMGILNGISLSDSIVFLSGRVPLDMLGKIVRANIPLVASNTVPTKQSVDLAKEKQITLIGKVRTKEFIIYAGIRKDEKDGTKPL